MEDIYKILEEIRPTENFKNSKNFIEDGVIDSFDIISLVQLIEKKYNIKINPSNILIDNFVSVDAILNLIKISGGNI